jgi:nitrite reductase/ring-hydroxylating ferredoxin subunit
MARDSRPVPAALRYEANDVDGSVEIDKDRFLSPEWAKVELEKVWKKVWQFAVLEDEIPEVGDYAVYEIGHESVVLVRAAPDRIRGFVNACLHRGRKLATGAGHAERFQCAFHGFSWNIDGSFCGMPCPWDFPDVQADDFGLPEVRVDTWRGFVFVNFDPDAVSLAEYMGSFAEYYIWPLEERCKALHIATVLPCNWKVAQDAFIEAHHLAATHPQTLGWNGDANTQYDATVAEPHWSRLINVQGVPSPYVSGYSEQEIVDAFYESRAFYNASTGRDLVGEPPKVPEGMTAREVLGQQMRDQLEETTGRDYSDASDSELLDAIQYLLFPNFHPWGGVKSNIVYRWRPNGIDPDSCIFELIYMAAYPLDQPKPKPVPVRWVEAGTMFADLPELGLIGPIFDQDMFNLPFVQEGLKASRKQTILLARYQESRIRHFNQTLDTYMAAP